MSEILALMSALCWGSTGVLLRAVREKSRFSFMLPEGLISIIVVVLFISILGVWSDFIDLPFNLIALMILAAFFNILGTLSYVKAMSKLKIGLVLTIITSSFILSTVFATQWILNDPVSSFVVVSAILIISGVIFINFNKEKKSSLRISDLFLHYGGLIFCLISGFLWCSGNLIFDYVIDSTGILQVTFFRSLTVVVIYLILSIWFSSFRLKFLYESGNDKNFIILAAFFATFSMLCWFSSLYFGKASLTVVLGSSAPIVAIILARIFLKETIPFSSRIGIVLCMSGVVVALI